MNLVVEALGHDISPGRQCNRFNNTVTSRLGLSSPVQEEQRLSENLLQSGPQPGQPMGGMTEPMRALDEQQGPASRSECMGKLKTAGQSSRPG